MIGTVHSCVCARPPGGRATCTLLAHTAFQSVRTRACRCRASRDIAGIRASRRMGSPSAGRSCTSTGSPLRGTPGRMVISRQISHLEPFVPLLSHAGLTIKGTILVLELGLHGFECIIRSRSSWFSACNLSSTASARIARSRHSRSAVLPGTCDGLEGVPPPPLPPSSPPEPEPVRLGGPRGGPRGDRSGVGSWGGGGGAPPDADEGTEVGVVRSPVVPPFGCLLGVILRLEDAKDREGGFTRRCQRSQGS